MHMGETRAEVIQKMRMWGGWGCFEVKAHQRPRKGNREHGDKESSANMAVTLGTERGRPLVPAESCIRTKGKATHRLVTEEPIREWRAQTAENQKSTEGKQ